MKLDTAIALGKECGLETVEACVINVQTHALSLFTYKDVTGELEELQAEYEAHPDYPSVPRHLAYCDICQGIATWHREDECLRCTLIAKGGLE